MLHPVSKFFIQQSSTSIFSEQFEDYYREPVIGQQKSGNPKNLVFIYAEGLERTWFDERLFPGVMQSLSKLRDLAVDFTNINQMPFTSWTIAGIVASQCGIPLVIASQGNAMSEMDMFIPGAVCLGDLLKANGYHSEFYGGADLDFAGKGKFFRTHGFASVKRAFIILCQRNSCLLIKSQFQGFIKL